MSSLRDRSNRLKAKSRGKYISFFGAIAILVLPVTTPTASATPPAATAGMYLDQPFVQGSYVAEDFPSETTVTTFNEQSWNNPCSFNGATLEPLYSSNADCKIQTTLNYGAASSTSSTPSPGLFPESLSYGQVGNGGASIVFNTPQTYFGMWWSAGSVGNEVQLLSGSTVVASTSANDVAAVLSSASPLTSLGNDSYATRYYIANPVDWTTVGSPTNFADQDGDNNYYYQSIFTNAQEPFVYIHFIAEDGVAFDRVNLIAPNNGFEFDNFTTSTATGIRSAGIPTRLVLQKQIYQATYVDFDANGGTGSLPRQYSVDSGSSHLSSVCLNSDDPTNCISGSYTSQFLGWSDSPSGMGNLYGWFYSFWGQTYTTGDPYPFTESTTLYAQWQTNFQYSYLTYSGTNFSEDVTGETVWNYVDENSYSSDSVRNFADTILPSPTRQGQYLEGWYTFDTTNWTIVRAGSPGDVVPSSTYSLWDTNLFGRWIEDTPPPPTVDAITPEVLLVYPRSSSVVLPNMPITGDSSASICLVESDIYGTPVYNGISFTDQSTSSYGMSTSYSISTIGSLVTNASRYVRVSVSLSSDSTCSTSFMHVVEVRPIGANFTKIVPLNLTAR
jgi:hypothetical protein